MDFLQKPLALFSNIYLRVQSRNCGRNSFLIFLFGFFFGFWEKSSSDFRPKNFKKLSKLPSTCPEEQFVAWNFFLKFWTVLDFLPKPSAWFSNFYIRVQSKKFGRNSFLIFLFRIFFGFWAELFSDFGEKSSKSCQNYLLRVQRNNLWLEFFFLKFESFPILCRNHWQGSQNSIYESRLKIAEKTAFFVFFSEFFRFLSEIFSDFWPNLQKVFKTTFFVSRGTICGLKYILKVLNRFGFSAETFGMVLKILSTCPE